LLFHPAIYSYFANAKEEPQHILWAFCFLGILCGARRAWMLFAARSVREHLQLSGLPKLKFGAI
jgi:hypothetical protein